MPDEVVRRVRGCSRQAQHRSRPEGRVRELVASVARRSRRPGARDRGGPRTTSAPAPGPHPGSIFSRTRRSQRPRPGYDAPRGARPSGDGASPTTAPPAWTRRHVHLRATRRDERPDERSSASATAISSAAEDHVWPPQPPESAVARRPRGSATAGVPPSTGATDGGCAATCPRPRRASGRTLVPSASAAHSPQPSPVGDDPDEEQRSRWCTSAVVAHGQGGRDVDVRTSSTPVSVSAVGIAHAATVDRALYARRSSPDGGMADAAASKAVVRKGVRVRVPLRARRLALLSHRIHNLALPPSLRGSPGRSGWSGPTSSVRPGRRIHPARRHGR